MSGTRPSNVVLVHGGFVDGGGWGGVHRALKKRGHRVSVVQNPTVSLAGDVTATRLVLDAQDGPIVPRRTRSPILPPRDGFPFLDPAKFHDSFAADLGADEAAFMADSQVPWGVDALAGAVSRPAWSSKPSWCLVATDGRMIPPDAQRSMARRAGATVAEKAGSHAIYVSRPERVAAVIEQAVKGVA